jgi:hypothetical protein
MNKKYNQIFESTLERFKQGGLLTGDLVKFRSNALTNDWVKKQLPNMVDKIKEFIESDKNIRVSAVKALRPAVAGAVQSNEQVDDWYCDVTQEEAPGLFLNFLTVPLELLEQIDTEGNLAPIPDSQKHDPNDERVTIKPEEVNLPKQDTEINAVYGTKTSEGDKELTKKNITQTYAKEPTTAVYVKALES